MKIDMCFRCKVNFYFGLFFCVCSDFIKHSIFNLVWDFFPLICRLSPIGESGRNSPKDITQIIIRQPSTSTKRSSYDSNSIAHNIDKRRSWLVASPLGGSSSKDGGSVVTGEFHQIIVL